MKSFANCCQNSHLFDLHLIEYENGSKLMILKNFVLRKLSPSNYGASFIGNRFVFIGKT